MLNPDRLVPDLVFDVGMHRGEDTAFYLRKGYRVVGFEANPALVAANEERFRQEIADGRVTVVLGAISAPGRDRVRFYANPTVSEWGTIDGSWVDRNGGSDITVPIEVERVDFGEQLSRHGTPVYLKIDIEGADRICLNELLAAGRRPTYLSIESEKVSFDRLLEEIDALEALGYDRFAAVQQAGRDGRVLYARDRNGHPFAYRLEHASSGPFGEDIPRWTDRASLEAKYRAIFRRYRVYGDNAFVNRHAATAWLRVKVEARVRRALPGWYDTHASTSDVVG